MERLKTGEQEQRAIAEREANAAAARAGLPLPYPDLWDGIDPTKVAANATEDEILRSHGELRRLCGSSPRRVHRLSKPTPSSSTR